MTPEEMLAEARAQYHLLVTGQAAVEFRDQNGELVRFTQANRGDLAKYIQQLEAQVNKTTPEQRGPMRMIF